MDTTYRDVALTIIAAIIVSLLISTMLEISVVPPYLHATNRIVNIFDFYDHIGCNNIYFIGSSQILYDIDTRMIGQDVYNLASEADTPLRRLIELNKLIETKPCAVIIGLTYLGLNDSSFDDSQADEISPVADKIKLDLDSRDLFTEGELKVIDVNPFYYNIKFIRSGLFASILGDQRDDQSVFNRTNFTIPVNFARNLTYQELIYKVKDQRNLNNYVVSKKNCRQKQALNHTICELRKDGIKVMILNMPLHPLLSARISNETRNNYFNFLNSTGVKYYDFETSFSSRYFSSLTHLNDAGRKHFTELLCPIVQ
jgi:hypothetical protein